MKTVLTGVCVIAALLVLAACTKKEEPKPATDVGANAMSTGAADMQKSVSKAASDTKTAVQGAAADAQKLATETAAAAQAKAQGVIDQAKSLVNSGKYTDAMTLLQQKLTGLQLTPDQQKLVDEVKAQIQKALESAAKGPAKAATDAKKPLGQ